MKVDFTDPQIWVAISFILFFLIFGKIIWKQLSGFLDNKILEIKHEINQAQQLHKDAKELLAIESKKAQDLDLIIKDIIDESKNKSYEILLENVICPKPFEIIVAFSILFSWRLSGIFMFSFIKLS